VLCASGLLIIGAAPAWSAWQPGTTIETFDGTIGTWDRLDWVPGSLLPKISTNSPPLEEDAILFLPDGQLNINEVYYRGNVHLELDDVPTDDYLRVDVNGFQHRNFQSNMEHWAFSVVLWFNPDNFVSLARVNAGVPGGNGSGGLERITVINGAFARKQFCGPCEDPPPSTGAPFFFDAWHMTGIELTDTEVKFYSSQVNTDTFENVDFDGTMTLNGAFLALDMPRPASFTGDCTVVVGKGYRDEAGDPWDFVGGPPHFNPKVIAWDATRVIIGSVPTGPEITDFDISGGTATVTFTSTSGVTNRLESATDLVASNFTETGATVVGDGFGQALTDPVGVETSKTYRVTADDP